MRNKSGLGFPRMAWALKEALQGLDLPKPMSPRLVCADLIGRASIIDGDILEVRRGLVSNWPHCSHGRYDAAQRDAERAERGIGASFVWRRRFIARAYGPAGGRASVRMMWGSIREDPGR